MKPIYRHIILLALAAWLLSGCIYEDELTEYDTPVPVAVNMTRAEGTGNGNYILLFWEGTTGTNPWETIGQGLWQHSLKGTAGTTPATDEVDYYHFGENNYNATNAGATVTYPSDNSPIHAVGYYPSDSLELSSDYKTLTLNTSNTDALPGLVDVCSTDIETGTDTNPFVSSKDNELQFNHTQVKLNFKYKRTRKVKDHIAEIWVTIPKEEVADTWTMTDADGYVASNSGTVTNDLVFASTEDWTWNTQTNGEKFFPLKYTKVKYNTLGNPTSYKFSKFTDCYVLPGSMFISADGTQAKISFRLKAVLIYDDVIKRYDNQVTIPLTNNSGTEWMNKVKAGDAFTIEIIFDQNRVILVAKKNAWKTGSSFTIPLNPLA